MRAENKIVSLQSSSFESEAQLSLYEAGDGVQLRTSVWSPIEGVASRGTVLILQGFTEFIEKYSEVVQDLRARGFHTAIFDCRGQGLSTRLVDDSNKGYVDSFTKMVTDAEAVYQNTVADLPRPHVLLGHSMGGNVAIRVLGRAKVTFDKAVLSAPMLGWNDNVTVANLVSSLMVLFGQGKKYALGSGPPPDNIEELLLDRLTSDPGRIEWLAAYYRKEPRFWMGGPTWRWVKEASDSIRHATNRKLVERITTDTILLSPLDDIVINPANHSVVAGYNSKIRLVPFPGSKHEILIEADPIRQKFWETWDEFVLGSTGQVESESAPSVKEAAVG